MKLEIKEHGNYGYAIGESAARYGLDERAMRDFVEQNYERMNVQPCCVLCDLHPSGSKCGVKAHLDLSAVTWHCNGLVFSRETIEKYRLESKVR